MFLKYKLYVYIKYGLDISIYNDDLAGNMCELRLKSP
jgi:hypothetical protein